jgi:hypothetical protein
MLIMAAKSKTTTHVNRLFLSLGVVMESLATHTMTKKTLNALEKHSIENKNCRAESLLTNLHERYTDSVAASSVKQARTREGPGMQLPSCKTAPT